MGSNLALWIGLAIALFGAITIAVYFVMGNSGPAPQKIGPMELPTPPVVESAPPPAESLPEAQQPQLVPSVPLPGEAAEAAADAAPATQVTPVEAAPAKPAPQPKPVTRPAPRPAPEPLPQPGGACACRPRAGGGGGQNLRPGRFVDAPGLCRGRAAHFLEVRPQRQALGQQHPRLPPQRGKLTFSLLLFPFSLPSHPSHPRRRVSSNGAGDEHGSHKGNAAAGFPPSRE